MRRQIRRLSQLRAHEWLVLMQLVPAASVITIASRHVRLERLVRWLGDRGSEGPAKSRVPVVPPPAFCARLSEAELYRLSDWATRLTVGQQRCLQRSLMVHWLLSRRGAAPVLELGVALRDGGLFSHAWVTVAGAPVGETRAALAGFRPILRLGAA